MPQPAAPGTAAAATPPAQNSWGAPTTPTPQQQQPAAVPKPVPTPSSAVATAASYAPQTAPAVTTTASTPTNPMSGLPPDIAAKANAASQQYIQYYQV